MNRPKTAAVVTILLLVAGSAFTQDLAWDDRFGPAGLTRTRTDGQIHEFIEYGGDLWMVGEFDNVDDQPAHRIARWNGAAWDSPGDPFFGSNYWGTSGLYAAVEYQDGLAVAGIIDTIDTELGSVGFWDGLQWSALDIRLQYAGERIYSLEADDDHLYIGGDFDQLVLAWDGSEVVELVTEATSPSNSPHIDDMVIWQGDLVVAGWFDSLNGVPAAAVARWDGATWHALGEPPARIVEEVFVHNGALHALSVWSDYAIYRWDGATWIPIPTADVGCSGLSQHGNQALIFNDEIYVSAVTWSPDGGDLGGVGRWTNGRWESLEGGMDYYCWNPSMGALYEYEGRLLVGGVFEQAGGMSADNFAVWDAAGSWYTGGPSHHVRVMVEHDGDIYVGGDLQAAFETPARHVARWDGQQWHALGGGLDGPVVAMAFVGDQLYVAGEFGEAGGVSAPEIARWDGASWHAVGDPLLGSGVLALGSDDENLYVGGSFYGALGLYAPRIMRWDGASWHDMSGGIGGGSVRAIIASGGLVYAAGDFSEAGGDPTGNVVCWDGDGWTSLDVGFDGPVSSLAIHDGELYAGGDFQIALGTSEIVRHVGRWDGAHWQRLGVPGGQGTDGPVRDLAGGELGLIVVGEFATAGGQPALSLARWDGAAWDTPGDLDAAGSAAVVTGSELFIGGEFVRAGGVDAHKFAHWRGDVTGTGDAPPLAASRLDAPYPNPFNPQTAIRYSPAGAGHVRLAVFDMRGRLVRTLVDCFREPAAGGHSVTWVGDTDAGGRASSGVYLVQMTAGGERLGRTVVMVK